MTGSPDEGYYVGNIAGVPRPLDDCSLKTWEVENGLPPNKGDPLKKSFSGSIYNLRTGSVFFGYIDLCQPFPLKAKYPALEDARCSTRISSYSAQYWWHHYSLPMLEAQKVGRVLVFSLRLACFFETTGMLGLASTWDEDLIGLVAAAIGTEFKVESICKNPEFHGPNFGWLQWFNDSKRLWNPCQTQGKGANVILGPSVNVHRGAANGRNFEYLSGEDRPVIMNGVPKCW